MKRRHRERSGKNGNSSTGHTNIQMRANPSNKRLHSAFMALDPANLVDRLVRSSIIILVDSNRDPDPDRGLGMAQKMDPVNLARSTLPYRLA